MDNTQLTIITAFLLSCWNGYLHVKLARICKNCVYTYTPKKKVIW